MITLHSVTLEWRKRNLLRVRHLRVNKWGRHLVAAMSIFDIFIKTGSTKSSIEFFDNLALIKILTDGGGIARKRSRHLIKTSFF